VNVTEETVARNYNVSQPEAILLVLFNRRSSVKKKRAEYARDGHVPVQICDAGGTIIQ